MLPKDFWLYQWLDSYLIKSPQQAMRLLRDPRTIPSLMQAAVEAAAVPSDVDQDIGFPIVAGSSLDLSGEVACQDFPCLKKQVDELFRSAWHYFDRIVIAGLSPRYIVDLWVNSDREYAQMVTESYLLLLLYLRNIGAESLILFAEKARRWCEDCGKLVLSEIGFHSPDAYDAYLEEVTDRLVRECEFGASEGGLFPAFTIYHPEFFDEPMDGVVRDRASARSLKKHKRSLIAEVVRNNVEQLITTSDLRYSGTHP
jgi:hypothetical protein